MKDLTGQKFGKLLAIKPTHERTSSGGVKWECVCECGTNKIVASDCLVGKRINSCGCAFKINDDDMIGQKFRRLLVIKRGERINDQLYWICLCDCGNTVSIRHGNLTSGNSGSCGCGVAFKHGLSDTPEYEVWASMKSRCLRPTNKAYHYYGGRGIKIYEPWIESFEEFYKSVGKRPGPEYSLDRIDCNGDYKPGNVKWSTPSEQWKNRQARGMTFDHFQHQTHKTAIYPSDTNIESVIYCTLGLSSEVGEVCGKVKRVIRDGGYELTSDVKNDIIFEMGDVLWYLSELANSLNISLETVAKRNLRKLKDRKARGVIGGSGDQR